LPRRRPRQGRHAVPPRLVPPRERRRVAARQRGARAVQRRAGGGGGDGVRPTGGRIRVVTFFCLGDLMVDVVARLFAPLAEGSDSPGVISYVGAGSAANTAAWLSRLGESSVFIGALGDDAAGEQQAESLHRLGVDV